MTYLQQCLPVSETKRHISWIIGKQQEGPPAQEAFVSPFEVECMLQDKKPMCSCTSVSSSDARYARQKHGMDGSVRSSYVPQKLPERPAEPSPEPKVGVPKCFRGSWIRRWLRWNPSRHRLRLPLRHELRTENVRKSESGPTQINVWTYSQIVILVFLSGCFGNLQPGAALNSRGVDMEGSLKCCFLGLCCRGLPFAREEQLQRAHFPQILKTASHCSDQAQMGSDNEGMLCRTAKFAQL